MSQGHLHRRDDGKQLRVHPHARLNGHLPRRDISDDHHEFSCLCREHMLSVLAPTCNLDHVQSISQTVVSQGASQLPAEPPTALLHTSVSQSADVGPLRNSLHDEPHRHHPDHSPRPRQSSRKQPSHRTPDSCSYFAGRIFKTHRDFNV